MKTINERRPTPAGLGKLDALRASLPSTRHESMARKIRLRTLTLASIPLLLVAVLVLAGLTFITGVADGSRSEGGTVEALGDMRAQQARDVVAEVEASLDARIDDLVQWSEDEFIVAEAAAERPQAQEMEDWTIDEINEAIGSVGALDTSVENTNGLHRLLEQSSGFTEILFTDSHGFTISATSESAVFHQEQIWWTEANRTGAYVSAIDDDNGDTPQGIEISVRILDPESGENLGVIRGITTIELLGQIADEAAAGDSDIEVKVMNLTGTVMADTSETEATAAQTTAVVENATTRPVDSGYLVQDSELAAWAVTDTSRPLPRLDISVPTPQWIASVHQPLDPISANVDRPGSSTDIANAAKRLGLATIGLVLAAIVFAYFYSAKMAERFTAPIRELRRQAIKVANHDLPALIDALSDERNIDEITLSRPIRVDADGEVAELANAFTTLVWTATDLAASEAISRNREVSSVMLNLGRRNQALVSRQLRFIDELERTESNPDALKDLFLLDQLATRMRRNAESLLVLAGEEPPRRATRPRPAEEVFRGSIGEVEDYARIAVINADPILIKPLVVGDLTHLLAELLENATNNSAPETIVRMNGTQTDEGHYLVTIEDEGIGMSLASFDEANHRIADPASIADKPTTSLGLYVVGRLAARHQISVKLAESASIGVVATIVVPEFCLAELAKPKGIINGSRLAQPSGAIGSRLSWPAPAIHTRSARRDTDDQPMPKAKKTQRAFPLPITGQIPVITVEEDTPKADESSTPSTSAASPNDSAATTKQDTETSAPTLDVEEASDNSEVDDTTTNDMTVSAGNGNSIGLPPGLDPLESLLDDKRDGVPVPPFKARRSKRSNNGDSALTEPVIPDPINGKDPSSAKPANSNESIGSMGSNDADDNQTSSGGWDGNSASILADAESTSQASPKDASPEEMETDTPDSGENGRHGSARNGRHHHPKRTDEELRLAETERRATALRNRLARYSIAVGAAKAEVEKSATIETAKTRNGDQT